MHARFSFTLYLLDSPIHWSIDVNVFLAQKIYVESRVSSVIERCKLTNGTRPVEVERENCLCCLVYLSFFTVTRWSWERILSIYTSQTDRSVL